MNKKKVYIASKMTGLPNYNYEAFTKKEKELQEEGYVVINPTRNFGGDKYLEYKDYIRANIHDLLQADAIYMFGDWLNSNGALLEHSIAKNLGLEIMRDE